MCGDEADNKPDFSHMLSGSKAGSDKNREKSMCSSNVNLIRCQNPFSDDQFWGNLKLRFSFGEVDASDTPVVTHIALQSVKLDLAEGLSASLGAMRTKTTEVIMLQPQSVDYSTFTVIR